MGYPIGRIILSKNVENEVEMKLSYETMLERMYASDKAYNGRFLTGVLSTGIYCLPSCTARKPKAENVRFFLTEVEAQERSEERRVGKEC